MNKNKLKETFRKNAGPILVALALTEVIAFLFLFFFAIFPYTNFAIAGTAADNVTVDAIMEVGNSAPEIINFTVNGGNGIDLTPNATTAVEVVVIAQDFDGEDDILALNATFFDPATSTFDSEDDNNNHYTNESCSIDTSYGDLNEINATCSFQLQYYANNATWNITAYLNDTEKFVGTGSDTAVVNALLALGLPDSIDFGLVNASEVSGEIEANVTNYGNVMMNLSLSGYGSVIGDGNAMNCTLGSTQNISIEHKKHNVTTTNIGVFNLTEVHGNYTNLSSSATTYAFDLPHRQNDTGSHFDDTNATFWRIYIPLGVAGTCSGNIVFGAVQEGA